MQSTVCMPYVT